MSRVVLFAAGLAGAFLAALVVGRAADVDARTVADEPAHGEELAAHGEEMAAPAGLAVEQDGYRLVHDVGELTAGRAAPYVFRIVGPDGETVRDFDVEHERRLHLIVVGREPDGAFLHLHPTQRANGAWSVPLELPWAGSYRVFADFTTGGERRTLGVDIVGTGGPLAHAWWDSIYIVELKEHGDRLTFDVRGDTGPVETQPYLGAGGHLVVLREGDLAYVHAHAEEGQLAFDVPFPGEGRYRLYLQFKVDGTVVTEKLEVER